MLCSRSRLLCRDRHWTIPISGGRSISTRATARFCNEKRGKETMLTQPTIEKLCAMRLRGMAEAFRQQQESADCQQLSFEERLGLLIDRQWTWRENRALERRLRNARLQGPACVEDIDYRTTRGLDRQMVRSLTAESAWVREHQNLFLVGPTGIGKT